MTDDELNAIRQRAEAATPGPWMALGGSIVRADDDTAEVANWISHNDADVAFIAHAREDILALIEEVAYWRSMYLYARSGNE